MTWGLDGDFPWVLWFSEPFITGKSQLSLNMTDNYKTKCQAFHYLECSHGQATEDKKKSCFLVGLLHPTWIATLSVKYFSKSCSTITIFPSCVDSRCYWVNLWASLGALVVLLMNISSTHNFLIFKVFMQFIIVLPLPILHVLCVFNTAIINNYPITSPTYLRC